MRPWALLGLLALVEVVGCSAPATRPGYDWGGYDAGLNALMKSPSGLGAYEGALRKIIARNPDGTRVPPGIYAEYGYVLFLSGRKPEAAEYFAREKARWPESGLIMDRMIRNCAPPQPAAEAPPASAPAPAPVPR